MILMREKYHLDSRISLEKTNFYDNIILCIYFVEMWRE